MGDEAVRARKLAQVIRATTISGLFGVLGVLLLFVALELRHGAWAGALTLALSLLVGGYLVGLLFAVPKTTGAEGVTTSQSDATVAISADDGAVKGQRTVALQRRILLVNTSFEQISDWLTKIIVGVGLVQFQSILAFAEAKTTALATDLAGGSLTAAQAQPVAAGILIAFPALGVLLGFYSVRLYIAWAIYVADADASRPAEVGVFSPEQQRAAKGLIPLPDVGRGGDGGGGAAAAAPGVPPKPTPLTGLDAVVVDQILKQPLAKLTNPDDILAWGRANFASGKYTEARDAFAQVISLSGDVPEVVLEYVQSLYRIHPTDYSTIIGALQRAASHLDSKVDLPVRQRVVEGLLNAYLYTQPPSGFTNAIEVGNKYVASDGSQRYASHVYLAAAHGQQYSYLKKKGDAAAPSELELVLEAVRKAVAIGGESARRWLSRLTTPGGDDDLVDAERDSEELKKLLGQ